MKGKKLLKYNLCFFQYEINELQRNIYTLHKKESNEHIDRIILNKSIVKVGKVINFIEHSFKKDTLIIWYIPPTELGLEKYKDRQPIYEFKDKFLMSLKGFEKLN